MNLLVQRNEIADLYAGIVSTTFDLEIREELQDCMVRDDALLTQWDEAFGALSNGGEEEWQAKFLNLLMRAEVDLAKCGENGKLRAAGSQLQAWWEQFWADEITKGQKLYDEKVVSEWMAIKRETVALRFNWETGYYFDTGKHLGEFWKIILDEPIWVDIVPEPIIYERYPLADFYSGYYLELMGEDLTDQIQDCLLQDDLHMKAYDGHIQGLSPYDSFLVDKSFATIMTLDEFNWAKCYDEEPKVAEMLDAHRNRWRAFWDMENASQVAESNYSRNSSEIESSIEDLQKAWNVA